MFSSYDGPTGNPSGFQKWVYAHNINGMTRKNRFEFTIFFKAEVIACTHIIVLMSHNKSHIRKIF